MAELAYDLKPNRRGRKVKVTKGAKKDPVVTKTKGGTEKGNVVRGWSRTGRGVRQRASQATEKGKITSNQQLGPNKFSKVTRSGGETVKTRIGPQKFRTLTNQQLQRQKGTGDNPTSRLGFSGPRSGVRGDTSTANQKVSGTSGPSGQPFRQTGPEGLAGRQGRVTRVMHDSGGPGTKAALVPVRTQTAITNAFKLISLARNLSGPVGRGSELFTAGSDEGLLTKGIDRVAPYVNPTNPETDIGKRLGEELKGSLEAVLDYIKSPKSDRDTRLKPGEVGW